MDDIRKAAKKMSEDDPFFYQFNFNLIRYDNSVIIDIIEHVIREDRKRLVIVEKALARCKEILDSLECICDEDYGFTCSLHGDRRLVKAALDEIEQGDNLEETEPRIRVSLIDKQKTRLSYDYEDNATENSQAAFFKCDDLEAMLIELAERNYIGGWKGWRWDAYGLKMTAGSTATPTEAVRIALDAMERKGR